MDKIGEERDFNISSDVNGEHPFQGAGKVFSIDYWKNREWQICCLLQYFEKNTEHENVSGSWHSIDSTAAEPPWLIYLTS